MRAAIFGGAGFLGRSLTHRCVSAGWDIAVYDLPGMNPRIPGAQFHGIDLYREVPRLEGPWDAVYYFAQSPHYRDLKNIDHLFTVNTLGALRAAEAASACGCRFFCYASSGNVYRKSFSSLREDMPVRRDDPYVLSKLTAEEVLGLFPPALQVMTVRIFGLFGPGQKQMLPVVIKEKILRHEPIVLYPAPQEKEDESGPEGLRISFCYVEDAALALLRLAMCDVSGIQGPAAVNLAGAEALGIKRFAEIMGKALGRAPVFENSPIARDFDLIADVSRLHGLIPMEWTPIDKAMEKTVSPVHDHEP